MYYTFACTDICLSFISAKTSKPQKNPTSQSFPNKRPIFFIRFKQEFMNIYHWFQQKPQNSKKNNHSEPLWRITKFLDKVSAKKCNVYQRSLQNPLNNKNLLCLGTSSCPQTVFKNFRLTYKASIFKSAIGNLTVRSDIRHRCTCL